MKLNGKFEEIKHEAPSPSESLRLEVGSFALCACFLIHKMGMLAVSSSTAVVTEDQMKLPMRVPGID